MMPGLPMHPMISALRRHKAGVVLIVLQIALTLAIVCNSVFIIGSRIERIGRDTGLDEADLFLVTQQWVGTGSPGHADVTDRLDAMQRADLATLRNLPDVASAAPINALPLLDSGAWNGGVSLKPGPQQAAMQASYYFSDENALSTLGTRLVAGRTIQPADMQHKAYGDALSPTAILITEEVANRLFPEGDALGKILYLDGGSAPASVVGIVAPLQTPSANDSGNHAAYRSILVPLRLNSTFSRYAVRAKPGRLEAAMRASSRSLYATNVQRVIAEDGIQSYADIKHQAYRADIGMAMLMGGVSVILLCVTAGGVFGLTSFWVDQRERHIGIRRALGARRRDILGYFHLENLMIVGTGAIAGTIMAIGLNLLLISRYEMAHLPVVYVMFGVLFIVGLSQFSTFIPARRAARVEPASAIRSM